MHEPSITGRPITDAYQYEGRTRRLLRQRAPRPPPVPRDSTPRIREPVDLPLGGPAPSPELGWHGMANWVKIALGLTGICVVLILLDGASDVLADALHQLLTAVPRLQSAPTPPTASSPRSTSRSAPTSLVYRWSMTS